MENLYKEIKKAFRKSKKRPQYKYNFLDLIKDGRTFRIALGYNVWNRIYVKSYKGKYRVEIHENNNAHTINKVVDFRDYNKDIESIPYLIRYIQSYLTIEN